MKPQKPSRTPFPSSPRASSGIDRRALLAGGLGLAAGALLPARAFGATPWPLRTLAGEARSAAPCLVLIQLTGGNDGLNTVIPHEDDAYHRARPGLAIPADRVQHLAAGIGLHPNLERLHAEFAEGRLAIVQGAGYPQPNRSHFISLEIWHTGHPSGRNSGPGWIGRLMELRHGADALPNRVVHIGGQAPYALHSSRHPAAALVHPQSYRFAGEVADLAAAKEETAAPMCEDSGQARRLAFLRSVRRDAEASSSEVRAAVAGHKPLVEYPSDAFARSLSTAAALIAGGVGAEVLSLELGGFDTHTDQRRRHDALMARLDAGLGAFLAELRVLPQAARTLVVVYSEFGRRVAQNGSGGTDHGAAGPMFVAGPCATGGLFGRAPSLTQLDAGDLVHTTDFRAVFGSAAEALFGVRSEALFGERHPPLALVSGLG